MECHNTKSEQVMQMFVCNLFASGLRTQRFYLLYLRDFILEWIKIMHIENMSHDYHFCISQTLVCDSSSSR